jgi:hypothetical protein
MQGEAKTLIGQASRSAQRSFNRKIATAESGAR